MSTADAVTREAAWLATSGDSLPALLATAGGPFDAVQAYFSRTPYEQQRTVYVLRHRIQQRRFAAQRVIYMHQFRLILWWPLQAADGSAEDDETAFDAALDLVLQRILGPLGDKTHGGRFLSVGEDAPSVEVNFDDPEQTIPQGYLRAEISYNADDVEVNA